MRAIILPFSLVAKEGRLDVGHYVGIVHQLEQELERAQEIVTKARAHVRKIKKHLKEERERILKLQAQPGVKVIGEDS